MCIAHHSPHNGDMTHADTKQGIPPNNTSIQSSIMLRQTINREINGLVHKLYTAAAPIMLLACSCPRNPPGKEHLQQSVVGQDSRLVHSPFTIHILCAGTYDNRRTASYARYEYYIVALCNLRGIRRYTAGAYCTLRIV